MIEIVTITHKELGGGSADQIVSEVAVLCMGRAHGRVVTHLRGRGRGDAEEREEVDQKRGSDEAEKRKG